jgi:hypothetical protein
MAAWSRAWISPVEDRGMSKRDGLGAGCAWVGSDWAALGAGRACVGRD